jgi:branched-chain amino acid aminotransferase
MPIVWLNGSLLDEESASISVRDTGLLHAAGVFTTMRSYGGTVFRLEQHLRRLRDSCEALFIPLQHKDEVLARAASDVLEQNNLSDARLRLTVTRGLARQDPLHGLRLEPTTFLTATDLEPYPQEFYRRGLTVILNDEQKLNPYDLQAGHKTLNYFSRLAALREANRRGAGEALWFDVHNYLQSGSISNVFVLKDGRLLTPPTPREIRDKGAATPPPHSRSATLPGVTRAVVMELAAKEGVEAQPAALTVNDVLDADEVFLTNSIMGVMPVCRIERKAIGADKPGPVTLRLSEAYASLVSGE